MFSWYLFNVFIDKVVRMDKYNFSYFSNVEEECYYLSAFWCHVTITILNEYVTLTSGIVHQIFPILFSFILDYVQFHLYCTTVLFGVVCQILCCAISQSSSIFCATSHRLWLAMRYRTALSLVPVFHVTSTGRRRTVSTDNLTSCQAVKFKFRPPSTHFSTTKSRWKTMLIYYLPTHWTPYKWLS